jgi:hypothetical protein
MFTVNGLKLGTLVDAKTYARVLTRKHQKDLITITDGEKNIRAAFYNGKEVLPPLTQPLTLVIQTANENKTSYTEALRVVRSKWFLQFAGTI